MHTHARAHARTHTHTHKHTRPPPTHMHTDTFTHTHARWHVCGTFPLSLCNLDPQQYAVSLCCYRNRFGSNLYALAVAMFSLCLVAVTVLIILLRAAIVKFADPLALRTGSGV